MGFITEDPLSGPGGMLDQVAWSRMQDLVLSFENVKRLVVSSVDWKHFGYLDVAQNKFVGSLDQMKGRCHITFLVPEGDWTLEQRSGL